MNKDCVICLIWQRHMTRFFSSMERTIAEMTKPKFFKIGLAVVVPGKAKTLVLAVGL
jgi:hypothetical protein